MKSLQFNDGTSEPSSMEVIPSDISEWPLTIEIEGLYQDDWCELSYSLNDNELIALFNYLYRILKQDYEEKLEELRQSIEYTNLTEIGDRLVRKEKL